MSKDIRYKILSELHKKSRSKNGSVIAAAFKYDIADENRVAWMELLNEKYVMNFGKGENTVLFITMKGSLHLREYEDFNRKSKLTTFQYWTFWPLFALTLGVGTYSIIQKEDTQHKKESTSNQQLEQSILEYKKEVDNSDSLTISN